MFGRAREPFCNWAPLTPFPLLGEEFVRALTQLVNGLSRYALTDRETLEAFEALGRTGGTCSIGKGLGEGAPSIRVVQKAVGRLTRGDILVRVERGEYYVQDDVFLEWLKRPT
ncbi:MAG: hypothetical protein QOI88_4407 [Gammaproteobacteria bacterium]|nr:hypothetical protein [Gammaproteobacteria bacterium]